MVQRVQRVQKVGEEGTNVAGHHKTLTHPPLRQRLYFKGRGGGGLWLVPSPPFIFLPIRGLRPARCTLHTARTDTRVAAKLLLLTLWDGGCSLRGLGLVRPHVAWKRFLHRHTPRLLNLVAVAVHLG